ncbi:DUF5071 domain-containing protein [Sphingomonas sp.]|uniref:DUF5071 domain-containing protein n=1 Tax=Sphingomonas sp. TaxID=28214 RepID=UPI002E308ED6|nr:DUF5071 domain-containing protein [Sphingomonas sp.]HEX4693911.1 DUF5071 domain-containing protein [Sphingomonas sp.]
MRLEISREALAGIRRAAGAAHPLEACGLLFGGEGLIDGFETTANVADDTNKGFEIDPAALLASLRTERDGGARLIGYWHSHPSGDVEPSRRDLDNAQDDGKLWVIIAGDDVAAWQVRHSEILDLWRPGIILHDSEPLRVANYFSSGATIKDFRHIPMLTGEIRHLIPRDKCDEDLVPMIAEAGYPAIAPILDALMPWTADPNWPIARPLIDYLVTLGEPMVEPIRRVLRDDDDGHKFLCLREMVRELPFEVQMKLRDDLVTLAGIPCQGDWDVSVDEEAREILAALDEVRG